MGHSIRILLVEDAAFDAEVIRLTFERRGVCNELVHHSTGEDAWDFLLSQVNNSEDLVDVALIDLNLPKMSGHELVTRIRADARFSSLIVMVLTASDDDDDFVRSFGNAADAFIQKPFDLTTFLNHLTQSPGFGIDFVRRVAIES